MRTLAIGKPPASSLTAESFQQASMISLQTLFTSSRYTGSLFLLFLVNHMVLKAPVPVNPPAHQNHLVAPNHGYVEFRGESFLKFHISMTSKNFNLGNTHLNISQLSLWQYTARCELINTGNVWFVTVSHKLEFPLLIAQHFVSVPFLSLQRSINTGCSLKVYQWPIFLSPDHCTK